MKETPRSFIHCYRERSSCGALTTFRPSQRALSQWMAPLERLKIWMLVGVSIVAFCYGFSLLSTFADDWFANAKSAHDVEVEAQINAEKAWANPTIGHEYLVPSFAAAGLPTRVIFRGWADSVELLPPKDNQIGDFWRVKDVLWVWAVPAGASFPSWVDP